MCSISRGWENTGFGRYLLKIQVALGGPRGCLGSDLMFLKLGRRYLLRSVPRVRRGRLSGWDVCGSGVSCTAGSGVDSGSVVSGTGSVLLLGPASSTMRTGDLWSMR